MYGGKVNQVFQKSMVIRDVAVSDDPNLNNRPKMEDGSLGTEEAFFIGDNFNNDSKFSIFGVLDGHGGKEVAEYVAKNFQLVESGFTQIFSRLHKNLLNQPEKLVRDSYAKLEAMLQMIGAGDIGATCCSVYFTPEPSNRSSRRREDCLCGECRRHSRSALQKRESDTAHDRPQSDRAIRDRQGEVRSRFPGRKGSTS